jgi:adenylate cyclase class 2
MYEVEVKVRADHDDVRDRLAELGAEPINEVAQEDTYYDAPHRDFAETDEALRVRRERPKVRQERPESRDESERRDDSEGEEAFAELTYKGPLVEAESKTRREVETRVEDGAAADAILDALGFAPAATVRKERERFALDDYTVTLDSVEGLGEFVEVETETEEDDEALKAARKEAYEILRDLGLNPDDQIRTSYLGLHLEQNSEE